METYRSKTKAKTIAAIIAMVAIVGIVILIEALQHHADATPSMAPTPSGTAQTPPSTNSGASSSYKDGTYTADAEYYVPHGYEDIKVTLTVAHGVVTDSSIVNSANTRDSAFYQEEFTSAYKSRVIGKSLADLKLSYIAGASATTGGFNDAVAQIRTRAMA